MRLSPYSLDRAMAFVVVAIVFALGLSPVVEAGRNFVETSSDHLTVDSAGVLGAAPMTIMVHASPTDLDSATMFWVGDKDSNQEFFYLGHGGQVQWGMLSVAGGNDQALTASVVSTSLWEVFVGLETSATDHQAHYAGHSGSDANPNTPLNADRMSIGRRADTTDSHYSDDNIGTVAAWPVALTTGEIAAVQCGAWPPHVRPESLGHMWPLDGGTIAQDVIGAANMTVTGTTVVGVKPIGPRPGQQAGQ